MPRGTGTRYEEDDDNGKGNDDKVVTTPPETTGPVTVVTEEDGKVDEKKDKKDLIRVRGAGSDNKVVLWEEDERHPDGQAWVCNDGKTRDVYPTAEVLRKIKDGSILRVNWNS